MFIKNLCLCLISFIGCNNDNTATDKEKYGLNQVGKDASKSKENDHSIGFWRTD